MGDSVPVLDTGYGIHAAAYQTGALFPGGGGEGVKLITRLHLEPGLMRGASPPLPSTSSWRGA